MLADWNQFDEVDRAYIGDDRQLRLFKPSPMDVCSQIGLNWWSALELRGEGWLSFDRRKCRNWTPRNELHCVSSAPWLPVD